ncbi:FHA domain-containing protein [Agrilutibacter solisilvae]|uniref:FHA domain-containing protein n=1 Tax=Agrilutibacter solisilvae TaxID=2763317 RepID=A0A974Y084_9GAMM|nr:FHA domain-containing protein [Lysobacter solisilvae]QSX78200.1 FHA domain-containing protein [Lysobacter solisilvae]
MSIKLVFPGGEHPQVLLGPGVNRVGSDPHATIVIDRPGVQPEHCQLHVNATGVVLDVPHGTSVSVNGRPVDGVIALRAGDTVGFDHVVARLASLDAAREAAREAASGPAANDDPGPTRVRPVLPMFVLRGVGGGAFGRSYPLEGPLSVGRSPECDVYLPEPGLSRLHARLVPVDDGVEIHDLGATNGTFLNDQRVSHATARIGDEIRFDQVRFRLGGSAAPCALQAGKTSPVATERSAAVRSSRKAIWPVAVGVATLVGLGVGAMTLAQFL